MAPQFVQQSSNFTELYTAIQQSVHFIQMKCPSLISPSSYAIDIQICQHERSHTFELQQDGWVLRHGRRICWLPYKRRKGGIILATQGQRVVIGAMGGLLTILDFSDLSSLKFRVS
jgi:hypothetical protein